MSFSPRSASRGLVCLPLVRLPLVCLPLIRLPLVRLPVRALAFVALPALFASSACGGADQEPLGGPHGGVLTTPSGSTPGTPANPTSNDAGSTSSSGDDAGGTQPTPASTPCTPGAPPATAPTFTQIYTKYFAPGATVDCSTGSGCHTEFQSEKTAWAFLVQYGQVGTTPPELTDPNASWLYWYGGSMPASGTPCNGPAMADLNAWAAAGGQNN